MPKLLLIDDKMDNLVTLSALLKNFMSGCAIITAQSGIDGIEKARAQLPDVILLDVKMPDVDGFETCQRLKSDERTKHIPVIMITAVKTDQQSRIKGLGIGADAFLEKPIDQYELVAQVNVALRIKKAEDTLRKERDSLERLVEERTAEIKENERRFRSLVELTSDWIWSIDTEGNYTYASPNVEDFLGYKPDEVLGKTPLDFMPQKEAERVKKSFQEISDERRPFRGLEKLNINKNGETVVSETSGIPIFDAAGNFQGYYGIDRDITERKQAELEKNIEKQKAEMYLNLASVMFIGLDIDGNVNVANEKACQILDAQKKDILGQNWFVNFIPQSIRHDLVYVFDQLMEGTIEQVEYYENQIITKTGKEKQIAWHNSIIRENDGTIIGTLSSGEDITEKKQLRRKLQQAQKMESIGTLAGGIAHDFNNILSAIIGFTELAFDETEKGTDLEDHLQEIYAAGRRAKELVKQILTFARQSDEEIKPVQINTIVKETLKFIRSSIPTTIQIKDTIESKALIMGSATHIHQIFMNLLTNAAHAMEDKGGVLEVILKDIHIGMDTKSPYGLKPGSYLEIIVSDTGEGITDSIIQSIFDPYFTTKNIGEGTGMGLAVVHGIIDSYNGKITVDSIYGKGTIFTIYLPTIKGRKVETHYEKETLPSGKEHILFVDDEAAIAKMGGKVLEQLGYTVTTRNSSVVALELFRSKPEEFDLVVSDMTMPNMTGDKLAAELMKIRPDIPVIICTGYSKKISEENAVSIGVKAFAFKPLIKADLAKTVRKVLDETKSST